MSVPDSLSCYGSATGERGLVRMELARTAGKTVISKLRTRAPLLVQKALYPDSNLPGMAHAYLMSSAGGILQGDRMEIDIIAGSGTSSRLDEEVELLVVVVALGANSVPYRSRKRLTIAKFFHAPLGLAARSAGAGRRSHSTFTSCRVFNGSPPPASLSLAPLSSRCPDPSVLCVKQT